MLFLALAWSIAPGANRVPSATLSLVAADRRFRRVLHVRVGALRQLPPVGGAPVDARKAPDEIRLPIPARLPEAYVASVNQRLVLYKRLASCRDDAEVDGIRDELLDRFGALPVEVQNLIEVIRLKIVARRLERTAKNDYQHSIIGTNDGPPDVLRTHSTSGGTALGQLPGAFVQEEIPGSLIESVDRVEDPSRLG